MKIDVVASLPHYMDHMLPIFEALPERLKGRVHPLRERVHAPLFNHLALVAGWPDVTQLEGRCKMIYVEHGAGQGYGGDPKSAWLPGYSTSGGAHHPNGVIGYIAPSHEVAARYRRKPAVAVGCPKMDRWYDTPRLTTPSVCIAWHWDAGRVSPEARSAYEHYRAALPQMVQAIHEENVAAYAHAHPRWGNTLDRDFYQAGFDAVLSTDREVFQQCSVLAMDNSSLMYEFASLDRPVVALNAPWYRRDVHHGLRFWSHIPGFEADDPAQAITLIREGIVNPGFGAELRRDAVEHAYAFTDGRASERAARWITQLADAM